MISSKRELDEQTYFALEEHIISLVEFQVCIYISTHTLSISVLFFVVLVVFISINCVRFQKINGQSLISLSGFYDHFDDVFFSR